MTSEETGSAAEEALRLLAAAEEWVRSHAGALLDEEHLANGSAACMVCPVCQSIAMLRQVRPETVAHLLSAGASLAAALRSVVAQAEPPTGGQVQRIDLDIDVDEV